MRISALSDTCPPGSDAAVDKARSVLRARLSRAHLESRDDAYGVRVGVPGLCGGYAGQPAAFLIGLRRDGNGGVLYDLHYGPLPVPAQGQPDSRRRDDAASAAAGVATMVRRELQDAAARRGRERLEQRVRRLAATGCDVAEIARSVVASRADVRRILATPVPPLLESAYWYVSGLNAELESQGFKCTLAAEIEADRRIPMVLFRVVGCHAMQPVPYRADGDRDHLVRAILAMARADLRSRGVDPDVGPEIERLRTLLRSPS